MMLFHTDTFVEEGSADVAPMGTNASVEFGLVVKYRRFLSCFYLGFEPGHHARDRLLGFHALPRIRVGGDLSKSFRERHANGQEKNEHGAFIVTLSLSLSLSHRDTTIMEEEESGCCRLPPPWSWVPTILLVLCGIGALVIFFTLRPDYHHVTMPKWKNTTV
jgi:hypothetical protein